MELQRGETPPGRDLEWRITDAGRRAVWGTETATCAACGAGVPLDEPHYYVAMSDGPSRRARSLSDEEAVFCDRECLAIWEEHDRR